MQDDIQTIAVYLVMATTKVGPAFPTRENAQAYLDALAKDPLDEYWIEEVGVVRFVQKLEPVEILAMPSRQKIIDLLEPTDAAE